MASAQEAVERVQDYLADRLSLENFEDWSASYMQNIHNSGDASAQSIARMIRSILNAYGDDCSDSAMRQEFEEAIRPFVSFPENRYGDPSPFPIPQSSALMKLSKVA
jgi:hypothetical protein